MRNNDEAPSADDMVDLAKSLRRYGTSVVPEKICNECTASPLLQNGYFVNGASAYSPEEKSKVALNNIPKEVRPSTDSLYFGKV
jgi:hypothetical protein